MRSKKVNLSVTVLYRIAHKHLIRIKQDLNSVILSLLRDAFCNGFLAFVGRCRQMQLPNVNRLGQRSDEIGCLIVISANYKLIDHGAPLRNRRPFDFIILRNSAACVIDKNSVSALRIKI